MKECSICLEPIDNGEEIITFKCKHQYHFSCVFDENGIKLKSCPCCRGSIPNYPKFDRSMPEQYFIEANEPEPTVIGPDVGELLGYPYNHFLSIDTNNDQPIQTFVDVMNFALTHPYNASTTRAQTTQTVTIQRQNRRNTVLPPYFNANINNLN